ncbi:unnamed protein product [Knipowitschia caucasica]|uniref:Synembryn n=1 Tax=Knipowitschia caucasica TaxID=637954 RepID=A0AAV2L4T1_KNICA
MDIKGVIEQLETGDQGCALTALRSFNSQMTHCFTFEIEDGDQREHVGKLVVGLLKRDLQPSCQLACLETIRILSRDRRCLGPFITCSAMNTLARYAGIAVGCTSTEHQHEQRTEQGDESWQCSENPDLEVIVEALKTICNIVLYNDTAQVVAAELQLIQGVAERLKQCRDPTWTYEVRFFDLRLTFQLTALRVDIRAQLAKELHGVCLLGNQLDAILDLSWPDSLETCRKGFEDVPSEELPPLSKQQIELAMEALKILFNVTFDTARRKVDEEEAAECRHLGAILRHCLMSHSESEQLTEEFHSHTINLLGNLPISCLDVLLMPKVQPTSIEYMGVNMDAVHMLLDFMERRMDREHKLKETLLPSLNLLTESSRIHRETRKFLRSKVLPPLRDVVNKPEVGETLRNKLVRLMTHIDTDVKDCAAEFLFVLCKESVSRFIKYTGYGNAAGLLAARGLLRGGQDSGIYSEDEDSETEEYKEFKTRINPITGVVEEDRPDPMEGMTEEQKEQEAMKLLNMFDKLSRCNVIQPMQLDMDGNMTELTLENLQNMAKNPLRQPENEDNSDEDES